MSEDRGGEVIVKLFVDKLGLDKLELAISGAAPLPPETAALWQIWGVNLVEAYGQTETGMLINNHQHPDLERPLRPGSMGCAMPGWTAAVLKADAYGCGIAPVAAALSAAGCNTFFVAHLAYITGFLRQGVRGIDVVAGLLVIIGLFALVAPPILRGARDQGGPVADDEVPVAVQCHLDRHLVTARRVHLMRLPRRVAQQDAASGAIVNMARPASVRSSWMTSQTRVTGMKIFQPRRMIWS